jgi:hypothetical protein
MDRLVQGPMPEHWHLARAQIQTKESADEIKGTGIIVSDLCAELIPAPFISSFLLPKGTD